MNIVIESDREGKSFLYSSKFRDNQFVYALEEKSVQQYQEKRNFQWL